MAQNKHTSAKIPENHVNFLDHFPMVFLGNELAQ